MPKNIERFQKKWAEQEKEAWCREHLSGLKFACFERREWKTVHLMTRMGATYVQIPSHPDYPSILLCFEILSRIDQEHLYAHDHGSLENHFQGGVRGPGWYNAIKWMALAHWCNCTGRMKDPGNPAWRFNKLGKGRFHGIDGQVEKTDAPGTDRKRHATDEDGGPDRVAPGGTTRKDAQRCHHEVVRARDQG